MQVTISQARKNLSRLIEAARAGENVVIAKGKTPVARIVAVPSGGFRIGILKGRLRGSGPDFFERASEEELGSWEGAE